MKLTDKGYSIETYLVEKGLFIKCKKKNSFVSIPLDDSIRLDKKLNKSEVLGTLISIENMFYNHLIESAKDGYLVKNENIEELSDFELNLFGFIDCELGCEVKTKGMIALNFDVNHRFFVDGKSVLYEENVSFIETIDGYHKISKPQKELCSLITQVKSCNLLEDKFKVLAEIKKFKSYSNIFLDDYLMNNEYYSPDCLTINPVESQLSIQMQPEVLIGDETINLSNGLTSSVMSYQENSKRRRTIFDKQIRDRIQQINQLPEIKGADIPRFYENPLQFIPEEIEIDIEELSKRVKGIKKVVYRSSPFIGGSSNDLGWFDYDFSAVLNDNETGENKQIDIDEYADIVQKAKNSGEEYVLYNDAWVHVDIDSAEDYIEKVESINDEELKQADARMVFDIFMNVDDLEYSEELIKMSEVKFDDMSHIKLISEPNLLIHDLYSHQKEGYSWLYSNKSKNQGSLLADDMGLGKTVQVIALLAKEVEEAEIMPSLLVLPKVLIENWKEELVFFLNRSLKCYMHMGQSRSRDLDFIASHDLVFVTYETLARDQLVLGKIHWKYVILDEAQKIKNITTFATIACKALKVDYRIALTGTPVENNLQELWSIIDYVQPGYLGSLTQFKDKYQNPIEKEHNHGVSLQLQELIKPVMLRRVKKDVLSDLPEKLECYEYVDMTKNQKQVYDKIMYDYQNAEIKNPLPTIQKLLQVSSHSELISNAIPPTKMIVDSSEKIKLTIKILNEIKKKDEKALIFTKYKKMQVMLQMVIASVFGFTPNVINGAAKGNRQMTVNEFNNKNGFNVLLLSPKAAGVGLNITGANHVFHYTREWNPAIEDQATDRAYRIGQKRDVNVYYLVTRNTVEEKLNQLLLDKRQLFENTIIPSESMNIKAKEFNI